jgi:flagellar biosynthesis protein FliQ
MTLTYVPKLLAAGLVLIALGPWMIGRVTAFAVSVFKLIPTLG